MLNVVDRMPGKDLAELAPVAVFERIFIVASVVMSVFFVMPLFGNAHRPRRWPGTNGQNAAAALRKWEKRKMHIASKARVPNK
jgi:hypothetical protein